MNKSIKYTLRKLVFLGVLAALVASPFIVAEYRSQTTTDPYILLAREIEAFEKDVDVLNIIDHPQMPNGVSIITYIPEFATWSVRQDQENFKRWFTDAVRSAEWDQASLFISWDYPPSNLKIQGGWVCEELRADFCKWTYIPSQPVHPDYVIWPGIGNP